MSTTGKLERLGREQIKEIAELDQLYFPRPWKREDWASLNFSHHSLWAWKQDGRVVGFALFATPQDDTSHLLKILVLPESRGSGVSRLFWDHLCVSLRNLGYKGVYLEVEESNVRARGFYEKLGFQLLRRAKSYYSDGADAIMMQLTL